MKIHKFVPDEDHKIAFADIEVGSLIEVDDKLYILVGVDPWCGYVVRYTWGMEALDRLGYWLADKTKRGYRGFVERRHLGRSKK
jgi:hypothetical protein